MFIFKFLIIFDSFAEVRACRVRHQMLDSSSNCYLSNNTSDISDNDDIDNASAIIGAIEQLAKVSCC
ncbi:unnamed protein product [Brugia pahangi]|uniref:Secreted protein n=1 Tax=Brugia pahangi TaxID=6280 RepID=A0A0N4TYW5_BRUPA|nr:unnamed protein product [Brugia pahangi]